MSRLRLLLNSALASRSARLVALALVFAATGCSKDLTGSPGTPPGTPVLLNGTPTVSISRDVTIIGTIKNQSGLTIYAVKVGMEVYQDDPIFARFTDTSDVKIDSLRHGETAPFTAFRITGDRFIDAYAVYSFLKP